MMGRAKLMAIDVSDNLKDNASISSNGQSAGNQNVQPVRE
jgi:hypothetical protein